MPGTAGHPATRKNGFHAIVRETVAAIALEAKATSSEPVDLQEGPIVALMKTDEDGHDLTGV